MKENIVCGAILTAVAGAFWTQRDYGSLSGGIFPDMVLIVLLVLGAGILVHGILRGDRISVAGSREVSLPRLGIAVAMVIVWAFALSAVGFTISGIVGFMVMAQVIRQGPLAVRGVVRDFIVSVVVVVGCFFIFTRGLSVPLPVSTLIGM